MSIHDRNESGIDIRRMRDDDEREATIERRELERLKGMTEAQAIEATTGMDEHPEGYDGPCNCNLCLSYGEPDTEATRP